MTPTRDASLLRHRRAVEAGQLAARGSGIVMTALLVAGLFGVFPDGMPGKLVSACLAIIAVMAMAEVLGVLNFRRPNGSHYRSLSALQVTADMVVMCGFVAGLHVYADTTTWPALLVPIVAAALRFRLRGAMVIWALISVFLVLAFQLGDRAVPPGELAFAVCTCLIIAFISGTQAGAFGRQISELNEARRALEYQAGHDPLTGLPNRVHLARFAADQDGRQLAVLLLDLDDFKPVNDAHGHAAGDELLCEVGRRIRAALRAGDLAGRLGGDEFQVLLPETGPEQVAEVIRRLRADITRPIEVGGRLATVGVSIGAAYRRADEQASLETLTAVADRAMYTEKVAASR